MALQAGAHPAQIKDAVTSKSHVLYLRYALSQRDS